MNIVILVTSLIIYNEGLPLTHIFLSAVQSYLVIAALFMDKIVLINLELIPMHAMNIESI